ncbi:MAG: threonine--tRNA ligase [Firmicutes bacterium]|jgi:threonyl-tRNA synthetase|nr:threonine--tRNA ligase [Bacillota bacterium]
MAKLLFPDDSIREFPPGTAVVDIVEEALPRFKKRAVAARLGEKLVDLAAQLPESEEAIPFEIITLDSPEGTDVLRHTAAHIMAQAVKRLWPEARIAIGPTIENGFYYDFDLPEAFTPEELEKIEAEMKKIIAENLPLQREELASEEAISLFKQLNEPYKIELIEDLDSPVVSVYRQGEFVDLCRGPHLPATGMVKAFKLQSVAGAYWRGDSNKPMLQRIYGTAFPKQSQLDEHLKMLEEAAKRDHRKLGQQLDLFSIHEEGPGFPFFHPKGMVLKNQLIEFWREEHRKAGYQEIQTPMILSEELWHKSGHWDHYKENMYFTKIDDHDFAIKPMNCPGGILMYKRQLHSYRDLPIRMGELGLVHRHELSGTLHGLMRVRAFTQDDAHIFMLPEQIEEEIAAVVRLVDKFYRLFGFSYHVELSTRPEKALGSEEIWDKATRTLEATLQKLGQDYKVNEGDGAFYGPKIDFHLKDSIGRTWQCGTIQLDFMLPERFDLTYIGADGAKHRPVMIHRVIYGSIERFIAILTEHYAGAFPLWLAPVQVVVLPLGESQNAYAQEVKKQLEDSGLRVEVDARDEKLGYRIREAQLQKIPYMIILGPKEEEGKTLSVRSRKDGDLGTMDLEALTARLTEEVLTKRN